MTSVTALKTDIEQLLQPCTVVDVARVLLTFGRSRMNQWTAAITTVGGIARFDNARDEASTFFSGFEGGLLASDEVLEVAAFAEQLARKTKSALLAARAMAFALDEVHGHTYSSSFVARSRTKLTADAPFPVVAHNPDFLGPAPDTSPRLKLFPRSSPTVSVVLSFEHASLLAGIPVDARIGALLPNVAPSGTLAAADLSEIQQNFDVEAEVDGDTFFWVRSSNEDQVDRIKRLVAIAEREKVDVALLPELCVTHEQQTELLQFLEQQKSRMFFTVGSAHSEDGARRMNLAKSFVTADVHLVHEKFNPYIFAGNLREDLRETQSEIVVHGMSDLRTLVVLVCKDLLAQNVAEVLAEMRLWLAIVPSLSPKADDFQNVAGILATKSQTSLVAAIASFGAPGEPVVVAGRPRKAAETNLPAHKTRAEVGGPALVTARLVVPKFSEEDQGVALIVHPI